MERAPSPSLFVRTPVLIFALAWAAVFGVVENPITTQDAHALTAVIEANEAQWIVDKRDLDSYGGVSPVRAYAPHAVLLEGWKSDPRSDIVEYRWDYGDGGSTTDFVGFNASPVYETPGVYTVTLTVEDGSGATATDTITVEVLEPNGTTYFVDAELGDDTNAGTSPGAGAWKTAKHAFTGMTDARYGPGDRVLFTRGQTFGMNATDIVFAHWQHGYGYHIGATDGDGAKPIIRLTGDQSGTLLDNNAFGLAYFSMSDLTFQLTTDEGITANFLILYGWYQSLLFLRVNVLDFSNGYLVGNIESNGFFMKDCNTYNSEVTHFWGRLIRGGLVDNVFQESDNHLVYMNHAENAVVAGNTMHNPSCGRVAMRISGELLPQPSSNIVVSGNTFRGDVDPDLNAPGASSHCDGTRYPITLVHFGPNADADQHLHDLLFEGNTVENAEEFMVFGNGKDIVVRNNIFRTRSEYASQTGRFVFGTNRDERPCENISFVNNQITSVEPAIYPVKKPIFQIKDYANTTLSTEFHKNIVFDGNTVVMTGDNQRLIKIEEPNSLGNFSKVQQMVDAKNFTITHSDGGSPYNSANELVAIQDQNIPWADWENAAKYGQDNNTSTLNGANVN